MAKVNLRKLASELATQEGLRRSAGGVAQMSETLALLGIRWRNISRERLLREVACLVERGGLLSEHMKSLTEGQQENKTLTEIDEQFPETEIGE